MSYPDKNPPLIERRLELRQQMQQQRQTLCRLLSPGPASIVTVTNNGYPRSMTMCFVNSNPELAKRLFTQLATALFGVRLFRSLGQVLSVARVVVSASITVQRPESEE